jgi:hypothetical protein
MSNSSSELQDVPEHVRHFIVQFIDSIELLRTLLLLQANPNKSWTSSEIDRELRSQKSSIDKRLSDLYARKILLGKGLESDCHAYGDVNPQYRAAIDELANQQKIRPYRIIELIYAKSEESLRGFANAFKLKREE